MCMLAMGVPAATGWQSFFGTAVIAAVLARLIKGTKGDAQTEAEERT